MQTCPHCEAKYPLWRIRPEFSCDSCGRLIKSNTIGLGVVAMVLASIISFVLPSASWSLAKTLIAYAGICGVVTAILAPFVSLKKGE
jgi:hypothetical protein